MKFTFLENEHKKEHTHKGESVESFAEDDMLSLKKKITEKKQKQKKIKSIFFGLIALVCVLGIFSAYSQYKLYTLAKEERAVPPTKQVLSTGADVIKAISKHILLPEGDPQIAEVKDAKQLRDTQAFFKDAKDGDIVVVYSTTIFLYRPSLDVLVASGDISGAGQVKP